VSKTSIPHVTHQESRGLTAWVRHHQLVTFFVLTYVLTWGFQLAPVKDPFYSIFQILGSFGPLLSAVILTALQGGRIGLRDLFARLFRWRSGFQWYLFVLLMPFILMMCAMGIALLNRWSTLDGVQLGQLVFLPLAFLLGGLLYGPFGEELGWRGYALPRLLSRWSALTSGLFLKFSHHEPVTLLYMGLFVPCALLLLLRFWPTQVARV
jgi:membrane protease YdiL (CAAX protease family)